MTDRPKNKKILGIIAILVFPLFIFAGVLFLTSCENCDILGHANTIESLIGWVFLLVGTMCLVYALGLLKIGSGKDVTSGSRVDSGDTDSIRHLNDDSKSREIHVNIKKQTLIFSENDGETYQKENIPSKRRYYGWRIGIFVFLLLGCISGTLRDNVPFHRMISGLLIWAFILFGLNKPRNTFLLINDFGIGVWKSGRNYSTKVFLWEKVSNITINKDKKKIIVYKKGIKRKIFSFKGIADFDLLLEKIYEFWNKNQGMFEVSIESENREGKHS